MSALVLGGAACLWDDLSRLERILGRPWDGLVIAVNDAGWSYPHPIDHWVTLHPEKFGEWIAKRDELGYAMEFDTWGGVWRTGRDDSALVDHVLKVTLVGSSGMHGVDVALHLGAEPVVIAGIPMDFRPHFFDAKPWNSPAAHRASWLKALPAYKGRVKSLSGWTADLLGTPSRPWLTSPVATL